MHATCWANYLLRNAPTHMEFTSFCAQHALIWDGIHFCFMVVDISSESEHHKSRIHSHSHKNVYYVIAEINLSCVCILKWKWILITSSWWPFDRKFFNFGANVLSNWTFSRLLVFTYFYSSLKFHLSPYSMLIFFYQRIYNQSRTWLLYSIVSNSSPSYCGYGLSILHQGENCMTIFNPSVHHPLTRLVSPCL